MSLVLGASLALKMVFIVISINLFYHYYQVSRKDPGTINTTPEMSRKVHCLMAKRLSWSQFVLIYFCPTGYRGVGRETGEAWFSQNLQHLFGMQLPDCRFLVWSNSSNEHCCHSIRLFVPSVPSIVPCVIVVWLNLITIVRSLTTALVGCCSYLTWFLFIEYSCIRGVYSI